MGAHPFQTARAASALARFIGGGAFVLHSTARGAYFVKRPTGQGGQSAALTACDVQDARDSGFEFPEFAGVQQ